MPSKSTSCRTKFFRGVTPTAAKRRNCFFEVSSRNCAPGSPLSWANLGSASSRATAFSRCHPDRGPWSEWRDLLSLPRCRNLQRSRRTCCLFTVMKTRSLTSTQITRQNTVTRNARDRSPHLSSILIPNGRFGEPSILCKSLAPFCLAAGYNLGWVGICKSGGYGEHLTL
jgi:hypothetical protein